MSPCLCQKISRCDMPNMGRVTAGNVDVGDWIESKYLPGGYHRVTSIRTSKALNGGIDYIFTLEDYTDRYGRHEFTASSNAKFAVK